MSHTSVDVIDFILFTIYPVVVLFIVEIISRIFHISKWIKLTTQGFVSFGFSIAYFALPDDKKFPLTAMVLLFLSIAILYQARQAKINPQKNMNQI